ncbi:hypothetical protein DFH09DRAFT_473551 [Mycena vulgaris]|nr:hypothetical protein DFH09DRAFT_473551 [Mycena vulgaris]
MYALYWITRSFEGVHAAIDADVATGLAELLVSPEARVAQWAYGMLEQLAKDPITAVILVKPCMHLVSNHRHGTPLALEIAAEALYSIARSLTGAQAIVNAEFLDYVPELLDSPSATVRKWTCKILAWFVRYDNPAAAVLRLNPWEKLVLLLQ